MCALAYANIEVSGLVVSKDDGEPVIGASVLEKGTSNGTITDFDGKFTITVGDKATLVVSYVGMTTQELKPTKSMKVALASDAIAMEEVVVTAMGVVQEKKRMNFAVQNLDAEALTASHSANFVSSLQGKVAGIQVTNGSGSPNAGSQIIVRGISSVNTSQSNEPLFIMDGMPLNGGASAAADINPNDIENVTVLKGAAAAALYGQDAANGVIMITTKKGVAGKITVDANASWQFDTPTRVPELQTSYMPGAQGFYKDKTGGGWGPLLNEGQTIYNNLDNYLQNGFYHKYDFSVKGGSEKFQAFASANWSKADGIIPNDYKQRFGALVKASYSPAKWVTIDANINVMQAQSRSCSGISSAYSWPITDDITNYQTESGFPRYRYYSDVNKYDSPLSPLYGIYNDGGVSKSLRNVLNGSITFKPVKGWVIQGRISYDTKHSTSDSYAVPRWDDSYVTPSVKDPGEDATPAELAEYQAYLDYLNGAYKTDAYLTSDDIKAMSKSLLGSYSASNSNSQLFTANIMTSYKLELPKDWSMDFMLGGEMKMSKGFSMSNYGVDFIIPGTYSLANTNADEIYLTDRAVSHSQRRRFGWYGEIRADYKGIASLSVTGRADWSSTINKNPFFYPSVTGGIILSELIPGLNETKNNWLSYWKIRGNYAVVGKDAPAYLYSRYFAQQATFPDNGYRVDPTHSTADYNLMPEMSYSWEIGMDIKFFDNRTRLDVAYYNTKVDNQIVTVRVSPAAGYILQTRNEGAITNQGVEATLDQDIIRRKNFKWTMSLNFGLNRGKVVSLPESVSEITNGQFGDIFPSAYLGGSTTALTGKDYERTEDGKIICDENGFPKISSNKNIMIGNREAKFSAGLGSNMDIYGVQFGFLFDGRYGGDVVNVTGRSLISSGNAKILEQYRGRQVVFDGVVAQPDGSFAPNTKPITLDYTTITNYFYNVSSNWIEDGSYIRLSYVTLGYDFAKLMTTQRFFKALKLNFTANNLFLLTRYTGSDPLCNASTGAGGTGNAGVDNYPVPSTRSYNISLSASF